MTDKSENAEMERLYSLVREGVRVSGQSNLTTGDYLKILADRGNEDAKAFVEYFNSPQKRFRDVMLDEAVKQPDSGWKKLPNRNHKVGGYKRKGDSQYDTPEELVTAYMQACFSELPAYIATPEPGQSIDDNDTAWVVIHAATIEHVGKLLAAEPDYVEPRGLNFLEGRLRIRWPRRQLADHNFLETLGFSATRREAAASAHYERMI